MAENYLSKALRTTIDRDIDEKVKRDKRAAERRKGMDIVKKANVYPEYSEKEQAQFARADQATALRSAQKRIRNEQGSGRGLLGIAGHFYDKHQGKKNLAPYTEQAFEGLQQARAAKDQAERRKHNIATGRDTGEAGGDIYQDQLSRDFTAEKAGKTEELFDPNTGESVLYQQQYGGGMVKPGTNEPVDIEGLSKRYPEAKLKQKRAQGNMSNLVSGMANDYIELLAQGAAISGDQPTMQNLFNTARSAFPVIEKSMGTQASQIRTSIAQQKPILVQYIRQASEMGARGMDSTRELDFYLEAATNPLADITSNLAALVTLNEAYGLGMEGAGDLSGLYKANELAAAQTKLRKEFGNTDERFKELLQTGGGVIKLPGEGEKDPNEGWSVDPL